MKSVVWFGSVVALFFISVRFTPSAMLAALIAVAWGIGFAKWLGIGGGTRTARDRTAETDYAVSSLDASASPAARSFARLREED